MSRIYIGGDSFCYYRDAESDWPVLVAAKLGYRLHGRGFPGDSWWLTRRNLLEHMAAFPDTETFIFCHTNPHRLLTGQRLFKNSEAEAVKQQYLRYFIDYDVGMWAVRQWYQELNQLLAGRQVLHFQSFASSNEPFQLLEGRKFTTPLMTLSLGPNPTDDFMNDTRRNHFDTEQNQQFAHLVTECLSVDTVDLQIDWHSLDHLPNRM